MGDLQKIIIKNGPLNGRVVISGAKNSALRLLAASILTDADVQLDNYPEELLDIKIHEGMLEVLGKTLSRPSAGSIIISKSNALSSELTWQGRSIRNTLLILGALVARTGFGRVPLPGGCQLGDRQFDLHVLVLERLGAKVWQEGNDLIAEAPAGLSGNDISLPIRSTGATENAIISATLSKGVTRLWNPHVRPEILDLVAMLNSMGAKITVRGQEHIEIIGVDGLGPVRHAVIADNMEAITWLIAASITDSDLEIVNFPKEDLNVVLTHLEAAGARMYWGAESVIIRGADCYPVEIATGPHPGINSDVQPLLAAWAARASGRSKIVDLRFPGRYAYALEMQKMGVQTSIHGDILHIDGVAGRLRGATVTALDLRAGAALSLCALMAEGETVIDHAWQISRGYTRFVDKLRSLGADVRHA